MIPGVDCQRTLNLRVTAVRVQFELRRFAGTHRLARIYMVLRGLYGLWPGIWVERLRCWVPEIAVLGGTNLHGIDLQAVSKHKSHNINKMRFATLSK